MATVLPVPQPVLLPVAGSADTFPVRRVYCVGRNYAEHAREMGDTGREPPFFFAKPADALVWAEGESEVVFPYPPQSSDVHHEVELVVALGQGGADLTPEQAAAAIWGYAIGLDMTRRDRQGEAKRRGHPWEVGKAFDRSAPIGLLLPVTAQQGVPQQGTIWLDVNGERRQQGDLSDMIWNVAEVVAQLSTWFTLAPGDLVFTGTPAGVGAVQRGDLIVAGADGVGSISVRVA